MYCKCVGSVPVVHWVPKVNEYVPNLEIFAHRGVNIFVFFRFLAAIGSIGSL